MNKAMKYLGVTGILGLVAYGVYKYLKDEKFKETVDDIAEEHKEKIKKCATKTLKLVANHPLPFIIGGCIVGAAISNANRHTTDRDLNNDDYDDYSTDEWLSRYWKEDYRDDWNRVNDFAKTLDLEEGESYIIEDNRQYGVDDDGPVVSHMIYGEGCYPPKEKTPKQEMIDDIGNNPENYYVISKADYHALVDAANSVNKNEEAS